MKKDIKRRFLLGGITLLCPIIGVGLIVSTDKKLTESRKREKKLEDDLNYQVKQDLLNELQSK